MRDPAEHLTPYLLVGAGMGRSQDDQRGFLRGAAASYGVGMRFNLFGNPRTYVRLQARDVMFRELDALEFSQHIAVTAAVNWVWRGRAKDQDLDGVRNWLDKCPNTPIGAKVDANGCPIDSDGDGVPDGLDKCPDTPAGAKVDADGCPIVVTEKETELLDTGMIRLNNVNFETGKDSILAESYGTLDAVGALLAKWSQLQIEIGGHTDNTGSAKTNAKLSKARAQSVENYILSHHPELKADQYTVKGYGSSTPIATNKTPEGKAQNRRVEFQVLNKDVLRLEIEKRTPVPADTTKK
jgi:outer membrane protein OmpA-like peptidoglycan-associated protein